MSDSSLGRERETRIKLKLFLASWWAKEWPMPEVGPVMMAQGF